MYNYGRERMQDNEAYRPVSGHISSRRHEVKYFV